MQKRIMKKSTLWVLFAFVGATLLQTGCSSSQQEREINALKAQLNELLADKERAGEYLAKFDTLDFNVFSKQKWGRIHESHDESIKVYWPDGHFTVGLEQHIEDLKMMFVYAPDTRVTEHPIRFASDNFTAVTGVIEGTFTEPMPIGNGKFMKPTGKSFKIPMCTIGIWENGILVEEHLFWDNQAYMKQIGIQ